MASKTCWHCKRELVNANGVHLGIPFALWQKHSPNGHSPMDPRSEPRIELLCSGCYDEVTVDLDTKIEKE